MTKKKFVFVPGLAWLPERRAVKSEHEKEMLLKEGKRLAIEENEEAFGLLGVKDYRVYLRRRAEHIEHLRRLRGKEEYEQKFE